MRSNRDGAVLPSKNEKEQREKKKCTMEERGT